MSVPSAKTPTTIPIVTRVSPAGPDPAPSPSASNTRRARSRPAPRPSDDEQDGDRLEDRDEGGRQLAGPEDAERPARRLDRIDVAEDDPAEQVRQRRADERPATSADETSEMSVCGPSSRLEDRARSRLWAMPTGIADDDAGRR